MYSPTFNHQACSPCQCKRSGFPLFALFQPLFMYKKRCSDTLASLSERSATSSAFEFKNPHSSKAWRKIWLLQFAGRTKALSIQWPAVQNLNLNLLVEYGSKMTIYEPFHIHSAPHWNMNPPRYHVSRFLNLKPFLKLFYKFYINFDVKQDYPSFTLDLYITKNIYPPGTSEKGSSWLLHYMVSIPSTRPLDELVYRPHYIK